MLKIIDWITDKSALLSGYMAAVMMLIVCYDVTMRYCFNRPTIFAQDISEYLIVYVTFMAAPFLLRENRHVRVSIVVDHFSVHFQSLVRIGTSFLGLFVCFVLFFWGLAEIWELFQGNVWVQRPLSIPKFITRLPIPFGSLLLMVHFAREIWSRVIELKQK
jgi:TRAP-type C4-dicarboxylate transport system permease small subunit